MTLTPPAPGTSIREEWDLLHELHAHPQLQQLAASGDNSLQFQTQLRRDFPDPLVRVALTLADLRRKAASRFSLADRMWFDRPGLEHASPEAVARHKAQRFRDHALDLCCGTGSTALALAEFCDVVAIDPDPLNCLRTAWNADVYGRAARVTVSEGPIEFPVDPSSCVHIAPDLHRPGTIRAVRLEDYLPGTAFLQELTTRCAGGAIQLSPAANFGGKFPDTEIELISLHGECKEAVVWFGDRAGGEPWRATVLPSGAALAGDPLETLSEISPPLGWVYDPDPAVVRAGLVDLLAVRLGLFRMDAEEEYLTGPALIDSPFVQGFEVIATLSNNEREIRGYFRTSGFGEVEIKCRHLHVNASAIRRKLSLSGEAAGVLLFARVAGKARALVCRRAHAAAV